MTRLLKILLCAALPAALLVAPQGAGAQTPTAATQEGFHAPSALFTVKANGQRMFTEHFKAIHYADFTIDGPTQIEVTRKGEFEGELATAVLSPLAKGIKCETESDRIFFTLPGPGWYVLTVNNKETLVLLANAPVQGPKGGVISVMDYVTDATGAKLQTEALQKALDAASGSGKTLVFPRGIYLTGTLSIGSDTDIWLEDGAMIKGSPNRDDYPTDGGRYEADHINNVTEYSDNGEFMTFSRLILIDNAHNVSIRGRGVIDGDGTRIRAQGKPANLVRVRRSKDVLIEGVILRDPAAWNTHIQYSEDVTIDGVKVLNDFAVPNTDGFDPDASERVMIKGCFAYCNDDNIAIKTTNNLGLLRDLRDVTVRGCVFMTRKSSLKVGTETKAALMENILFENNDVIMCDRGLALYCNDGATFRNVRFINNRIERNFPDNQRKAIHFKISERYGKGRIEDVLIRDCSFGEAFPRGSSVEGLDAEHMISGLVIDNVTVAGKKVAALEDLGIKQVKFTEKITIK